VPSPSLTPVKTEQGTTADGMGDAVAAESSPGGGAIERCLSLQLSLVPFTCYSGPMAATYTSRYPSSHAW
jgi:hypothetical protein